MFVTGANLFNQWSINNKIINGLQPVPAKVREEKLDHADLICISWSYNVWKIADNLFLSGSWNAKDGQFVMIPLPDMKISTLLVACNDYKIVMADKSNNVIRLLDLKTEQFQRVHITEKPHDSNESQNIDTIIKVRVTGDSFAFLTKEGNVFVGQLPSYVDTRHCIGRVCDVQCGYEHFVLLTDVGSVYTWGTGRRLQLGHGDLEDRDVPSEVNALGGVKIVKISANGWHTLALSESGDLYVWGWNDTGQMGIKYEDDNFSGVPTLVTIYDDNGEEVQLNVKDVACGTRHSVILLEDNSVWSAGSNKYGQLGFSLNITKCETFKKCFNASQGDKIICGPWCTVIKP